MERRALIFEIFSACGLSDSVAARSRQWQLLCQKEDERPGDELSIMDRQSHQTFLHTKFHLVL